MGAELDSAGEDVHVRPTNRHTTSTPMSLILVFIFKLFDVWTLLELHRLTPLFDKHNLYFVVQHLWMLQVVFVTFGCLMCDGTSPLLKVHVCKNM